jgi:hypothetical protein
MVAAPVVNLFHGIAASEDGAGAPHFIEKLAANSRGIDGLLRGPNFRGKSIPFVKPHEVVATRVAWPVVRTSDESVK